MLCIYGRYKHLILSEIIEQRNLICYSIISSTTSCLSATTKLLHFVGLPQV